MRAASWAGSWESASAALIMSAPMKIMNSMPLVCAVLRRASRNPARDIRRRFTVTANVSSVPMEAPSVAVNRPP